MTDARAAPGVRRLVALLLLLAAGILSLPLAALAFDGEGTENFILPAQLAGMAVFGAVVGYLLPGLGVDAVGVDWRIPLDEASARLGGGVPLQGNIDPALLTAPWPVVQAHVGLQMPPQTSNPWLSIIPIAESRSSYNGLLVFVFIIFSTLLAVQVIHRFASRGLRRAPAWDCGTPQPSPITQYTADSFAQPVRRVFGDIAFLARERVDMPLPGETRPARLEVRMRDIVWKVFYAPIQGWVELAAEKLNYFQFLTIRRYLSLVFLALVTLLLMVATWP